VLNGLWHHVAGTFDGTKVRIYVDGVEVSTGTTVAMGFAIKYDLPTTTALLFGNYDAGSTYAFNFHYNGLLDEAHIWARPLNTAEIAFIAGAYTKGELVRACPRFS